MAPTALTELVLMLCALSTACWRQLGQCAAFLPAWGPWVLMLLVVPGFAPLGWLYFSLPMCSGGLQWLQNCSLAVALLPCQASGRALYTSVE